MTDTPKTVLPKIVEEYAAVRTPFRAWNTESDEFFIQVLHNPFEVTEAKGKTLAVELQKRKGEK